MKTISKVLALVLTIAMLVSVSAFAAEYQAGTNGETITFSFVYTTGTKVNTEADAFDAGATVYVHVLYEGNAEGATGIANVDMPIGYDSEALTISAMTTPLPGMYANNMSYGDGVAWVTWVNAEGAYDSEEEAYLTEGTLTRIKFTAKKAITAADIASGTLVKILSEGTATDGTVGKLAVLDGAVPTPGKLTVIGPDVVEVPDEPVIEYEEKGDALTADKSVEAADGTTWNELAIYKASFNLDTLVAEQGYGFKVNNEKKAITINGTGTVDYVLAFFGVAADKVPAVSTYYTVVK